MMRYIFTHRMIAVLLVFCVFAVLLSGCGQENKPGSASAQTTAPTEGETVTLRILVEDSLYTNLDDGLHSYLRRYKNEFSVEHRNVEIVVEEIPKEDGREEVLQRLRAELMVGEGPDILLLPTLPTAHDHVTCVEPLFPDMQQAMRNGLFLDIAFYYDADTELNKELLNETVMDAGLLEGGRYVLPLSYDLPMVCVDRNTFAESGVPQDIFTYNAVDLLNAVAQLEDSRAVGSFFQNYYLRAPLSFNFFPQLIDYETGQVSVTQDDLAAYLQAWQAYRVRLGDAIRDGCSTSGTQRLSFYYGDKLNPLGHTYWVEDGHFASCDSLKEAASNVLLARNNGVELDMYPMRAVDGSVVADVTLYAAVSSGCREPELAYAFIRDFLGEHFQWQTEKSNSDLEFYGWPVRTKGSVAPVCDTACSFVGSEAVNRENVTDAEMPILDVRIDHVRFSIPLETEFGDTVISVYDFRNARAADVDIDKIAEDWIKKLQIHSDEG